MTSAPAVSTATPARRRRPPEGFAALCVVLLVYFVINIVTADRSPTVWADEVLFSDPAINYLQGRGFTSSAWQLQTDDETWCGQCPLHTFILVPWLKAFGISPRSVRSINYAYAALTALLTWLALRRPAIGFSSRGATLVVAVMLCTYGATFAYRSGRYDGLGMCLCGIAFFLLTSQQRRVRWSALIPVALMPLAGLYLVPLAGIVAAASFLMSRQRWLERLIILISGFALGGVLLYAVIAALGDWHTFVESARLNSNLGVIPARLSDRILMAITPPFRPMNVPSYLALATAAVLALFPRRHWRPIAFALVAGYAYIVTVNFSRAQVPVYNFWMPEWLLLIAAVAVWQRPTNATAIKSRAVMRCAISFCLIAAACAGLPARLTITALQWRDRDPSIPFKLLENQLKPTDIAYADWRAYYPARFSGATVHFEYHERILTPEDRARTNVLIIPPGQLPEIEKTYGAGWREIARVHPAHASTTTKISMAPLYDLALYRRDIPGDSN